MSELKLERISHPDAASTSIEIAASGAVSFSNDIAFNTDTFFVDTANGRVGIGTTSPDQTLHVHKGSAGTVTSQALSVLTLENNTTAILQFLTPATSSAQIRFGDPSDNGAGYIDYSHSSNVLSFGVNGPEKMRIDSSGNLLVGKTSTNTNSAGTELKADGFVGITRDDGRPMQINRLTSDGDIVQFRKDGTTFGSIGSRNSANAYMSFSSTNSVGLSSGSNSGQPYLAPASGSGALADDALDIGYSSFRFKNLYLSGGVYLGGTGSSNHLQDYEEGTWTPVFAGTTDAGTITFSNNGCKYTKIGDLVHVSFSVTFTGISGATGSYLSITGLPFTKQSSHNPCGTGFFTNLDLDSDTKMVTWAFNSTGGGGLTTLLYESKDNTSVGLVTPSQYNSNTALNFSMTYLAQ